MFGAAHLITWTYAIIAGFIGAYLGLLWIWSGNLLKPMVTHAVYDFAALVNFLRVYRSRLRFKFIRVLQTGALRLNNPFTLWRFRTRIVNTPSTVPKGIKRHSTQAITKQNV